MSAWGGLTPLGQVSLSSFRHCLPIPHLCSPSLHLHRPVRENLSLLCSCGQQIAVERRLAIGHFLENQRQRGFLLILQGSGRASLFLPASWALPSPVSWACVTSSSEQTGPQGMGHAAPRRARRLPVSAPHRTVRTNAGSHLSYIVVSGRLEQSLVLSRCSVDVCRVNTVYPFISLSPGTSPLLCSGTFGK